MIQSDGRVPQPCRIAGSKERLGVALGDPKFKSLMVPQVSAPLFASGFCRLQSGTKFLFVSVHERVTLTGMRDDGNSDE